MYYGGKDLDNGNLKNIRIEITPTLECNLDCSYCIAMQRKKLNKINVSKVLKKEHFKNFVDSTILSFYDYKKIDITISGGECTLNKDLSYLIDYAIKNILNLNKIYILTNGTGYLPELKEIKKISKKVKMIFTYHDEQLNIDNFCNIVQKYINDDVFNIVVYCTLSKINQLYFRDIYSILSNRFKFPVYCKMLSYDKSIVNVPDQDLKKFALDHSNHYIQNGNKLMSTCEMQQDIEKFANYNKKICMPNIYIDMQGNYKDKSCEQANYYMSTIFEKPTKIICFPQICNQYCCNSHFNYFNQKYDLDTYKELLGV